MNKHILYLSVIVLLLVICAICIQRSFSLGFSIGKEEARGELRNNSYGVGVEPLVIHDGYNYKIYAGKMEGKERIWFVNK